MCKRRVYLNSVIKYLSFLSFSTHPLKHTQTRKMTFSLKCPTKKFSSSPDWLESSWLRAARSLCPAAGSASGHRRVHSRRGRYYLPQTDRVTRVWGRNCCHSPGCSALAGGCRSSGPLPAGTGCAAGR